MGMGLPYSSHSKGKWDEKGLNRVHTHTHTCTLHTCQKLQKVPSSVRDHRHSPLTQKQKHTCLSTHWSSETGELNKQALFLVFVMNCWAARCNLLCCGGCLPLKKTHDVSRCLENEQKSPSIQKGRYKVITFNLPVRSTLAFTNVTVSVCCNAAYYIQAGCTRKWNSGVCIYEFICTSSKIHFIVCRWKIWSLHQTLMINIMKCFWILEEKALMRYRNTFFQHDYSWTQLFDSCVYRCRANVIWKAETTCQCCAIYYTKLSALTSSEE